MRSRTPLRAVAAVYGGGLIVGATLDSFPASSGYLTDLRGLSDLQYGAIYIPQLLTAIAGAVSGGIASRRLGLPLLFKVSAVCFLLAQALLMICCAPAISLGSGTTMSLLMLATALFGFGFGFGGGPLNGLAALLFANSANTAITALHMCAGAGLTLAPFVFTGFAASGHEAVGIGVIALLTLLVLAAAVTARLPSNHDRGDQQVSRQAPRADIVFWLIVVAAIAYAIVEGTFANWAVIFVSGDLALSPVIAATSLAVFWGALTLGRLGAAVLAFRIKPIAFLLTLPFAMVVALFMVRQIETPEMALSAFAVAGLACSAYFPMLVGFGAEEHPERVSWLASMLTAALMTGVGIGSYATGSLRGWIPFRTLYAYSSALPIIAVCMVVLAFNLRRARAV